MPSPLPSSSPRPGSILQQHVQEKPEDICLTRIWRISFEVFLKWISATAAATSRALSSAQSTTVPCVASNSFNSRSRSSTGQTSSALHHRCRRLRGRTNQRFRSLGACVFTYATPSRFHEHAPVGDQLHYIGATTARFRRTCGLSASIDVFDAFYRLMYTGGTRVPDTT